VPPLSRHFEQCAHGADGAVAVLGDDELGGDHVRVAVALLGVCRAAAGAADVRVGFLVQVVALGIVRGVVCVFAVGLLLLAPLAVFDDGKTSDVSSRPPPRTRCAAPRELEGAGYPYMVIDARSGQGRATFDLS
jgi:hypothetical protein